MGISLRKALYNINNKRYKSGFIKLSAIPTYNHTTLEDGAIMSNYNNTRLEKGIPLSLLGDTATASNSNRVYLIQKNRHSLSDNPYKICPKYIINRHASRKLLLSLSYIVESNEVYEDEDE